MVKLSKIFHELKPIHALVIGDFMVDKYTFGKVERISPEAPVPVLHVQSQKQLPGGAGNVVMNLKQYQCKVSVIGRIGDDDNGKDLIKLFDGIGVQTKGLFIQPDYHTILKNRMISDSQQLIRVDFENLMAVTQEIEKLVYHYARSIIDEVDVVAISDYGKGFLNDRILRYLIDLSREKHKPVIVDPKGIDFAKYAGADVIKPNRKEAYLAAGCKKEETIEFVGNKLFCMSGCSHLIITRSESGISLFNREGSFHFPVMAQKEVLDVTGAGDTVLAMLAFGLGNARPPQAVIPLANIAAGIAVEHIGCVSVSLSDIAKRILAIEGYSKILDQSHLNTIKYSVQHSDIQILVLDEPESNLIGIFHIIQKLAQSIQKEMFVVYLKRSNYSQEFLSFLSSIPKVDFILLTSEPLSCHEFTHVKDIYFFSNNSLQKVSSLQELNLKHSESLI
ncbi:MAG: HldE protein [Chlamydiales bacterium]|nr:HldE protein [Chlamydiales bacterium]